jgi:hypothetical protein
VGVAYQSLRSAVKSMTMVSPELGVGSLQRRVSRGLGLLDAVTILLDSFAVETKVPMQAPIAVQLRLGLGIRLTRCDAPSWTDCAETSS